MSKEGDPNIDSRDPFYTDTQGTFNFGNPQFEPLEKIPNVSLLLMARAPLNQPLPRLGLSLGFRDII